MSRYEREAAKGRKQSSAGGGSYKLVTADELLADYAQAYPGLAPPGARIVAATGAQLAGALSGIANIHRSAGRTAFAGGANYIKVMSTFGAQSFRVGLPIIEMVTTVGSVLLGLIGSRELAIKALQDLCHDAVSLYDQNVDDAVHTAMANAALEGLRYVASKQALGPGMDGSLAATVMGIIQAQALLSSAAGVAQHITPVTPAGAPAPSKTFWEKAAEVVADDLDGAAAGAAIGAVKGMKGGPVGMVKGAAKGAVAGVVADEMTDEEGEASSKSGP